MFGIIGIVVIVIGVIGLWYGFEDESKILKTGSSAVIVVGIVLFALHFTTESGKRFLKTFNSDVKGGIERTVEVYDQQGNLLKEYKGKLDVETNEYGNKVLFDLNGKRTVIYNAIVIVQED